MSTPRPYDEFVPPGHPGIGILLHRCGGQPCVKGTRLPAAMFKSYRDQGYKNHEIISMYPTVTPVQIEAAIAWCSDPDHKRIERNALRRQRYAEDKERRLWHRSQDEV